jgi:hypothetical protein
VVAGGSQRSGSGSCVGPVEHAVLDGVSHQRGGRHSSSEKKIAVDASGRVSPGKPRGTAAMDCLSIRAWELAAARGTSACVAEGAGCM